MDKRIENAMNELINTEIWSTGLYLSLQVYFEIEQEDGDKKYGKSKEHRPNPIIQMGLFTDGDGIPLAFSLFLNDLIFMEIGCKFGLPNILIIQLE